MPAPPFLSDETYEPFDIATEWAEVVENTAPGGPDAFTREKADCMLVSDVYGSRDVPARRTLFGYVWI